MSPPPPDKPPSPHPGHWLNRTVVGAGLTSLLADAGYEMATAALPDFLRTLAAGVAPAALGTIEGAADALSNFVKLGSGWLGDRVGRRKPVVVFGYAVTGVAHVFWTLAAGLPLVMFGKLVGWFGKGVRGPLRNAILAQAVSAADCGKAFGLHRAADTVGAILGPLAGAALLYALVPFWPEDPSRPYRAVFFVTLIPGLGAALTFALMVREEPTAVPPRRKFFASLGQLPAPFRRYLVGVGVFGLGDFTRTLLILAASTLLEPAYGTAAPALAMQLYAWHNLVQALTALPVGALSDRIGRRGLLAMGYALGAAVSAAVAVAMSFGAFGLLPLAGIFAVSGIYVAVEESLEGAMTADLVPDPTLRGTAYGTLGATNGAGDLVASLLVGWLWLIAPALGFAVAAGLMTLGAVLLYLVR